MEQEIRNLIARHYKQAQVFGIDAFPDTISLNVSGVRMAWLAKRLLARFPKVYWVRFVGGWTTSVYSRETLKWLGL